MITVVCVGIENQGNLGAIARVMANFGVHDLVLINHVCKIEKEALDRASHAKSILKKAKITSLDVLKKYDYVIGTTSMLGTDYNLPRSPVTPEQLVGMIDSKKKIALLLGRESHGLSNMELEQCDFTVTIPSSKDYPVMNISHACAVMLYELSKKTLPQKKKVGENITAISGVEKKQILKQVDEILDSMHFITEKRKETQQTLWKRIVGKSFLTKREAYALMGFLKKFKLK
ncbi:MAG: RNA methyltransferase [Nanoarchaeota archaeon]|nr:RNA methyltransferase [Nanoarchaeota archaeon]